MGPGGKIYIVSYEIKTTKAVVQGLINNLVWFTARL